MEGGGVGPGALGGLGKGSEGFGGWGSHRRTPVPILALFPFFWLDPHLYMGRRPFLGKPCGAKVRETVVTSVPACFACSCFCSEKLLILQSLCLGHCRGRGSYQKKAFSPIQVRILPKKGIRARIGKRGSRGPATHLHFKNNYFESPEAF